MKRNLPLFVSAILASLSANVFAHYDPFLPGQHTHMAHSDDHAMLIAAGLLLSVFALKKISQKILAVLIKKK